MALSRREVGGSRTFLPGEKHVRAAAPSETTLHLDSHEEAMQLFGPGDRNLKLLREAFAVELTGRGSTIKLAGGKGPVTQVTEILGDMISRYRSGAGIPPDMLEKAVERHLRKDSRGDAGGEIASSAHSTHAPHRAGSMPGVTSERSLIREVARSAGQGTYLQAILENELVFCIGPAGTGKTFLAVYMAIQLLREDRIRRIILCRPAVEAGEKLGFLPGDFQAKINPYLRPLYDALNDLLDYDQVKRYLEREIIEILPIAYMRGRTLNNAFIILDEGQNTSVSQMKMFLTRMGMNSRIVVNGDVTQVDLPEGQLSGMIHAQRIIRDIPGIAWIELDKADIVRHPLVRRIVAAYEAAEAPQANGH